MTEIPGGPPRFRLPTDAQPRAERKAPAQKGGAKAGAAKGGSPDSPARTTLGQDSFSRAVTGTGGINTPSQEGPRARIRFAAAGPPTLQGELREGGRVTLEYHPDRQGPGMTPWVTVRFEPRGEQHERQCAEVELVAGRPTGRMRPAPVTLDVPVPAQAMEVRFGPRADGPHRFPIKPRARVGP
ncbi:MAG: hypothetical protein HY904_09195 [Deltaproteobacteria bacterium]|nr:hypothetical protein [Deltaproteobacteria bacterium]